MSAYILGRLYEMNVIFLFSVECFIYKLVLTNILVSLNPSSQGFYIIFNRIEFPNKKKINWFMQVCEERLGVHRVMGRCCQEKTIFIALT